MSRKGTASAAYSLALAAKPEDARALAAVHDAGHQRSRVHATPGAGP